MKIAGAIRWGGVVGSVVVGMGCAGADDREGRVDDGVAEGDTAAIEPALEPPPVRSMDPASITTFGALPAETAVFGLGTQYDTGTMPSVALNAAGTVVETHRSEGRNALFYRVGAVRGPVVDWGPSVSYDAGTTPSVALGPNGTVVEVHRSGTTTGLFYRVGVVDAAARTIHFGGSVRYDAGSAPRIAMTDDGWVVEVHKSELWSSLWYRVGRVDVAGLRIEWGDSQRYGTGASPVVALTADGGVVESHASESGTSLWSHVGRLDRGARRVSFGDASSYDSGTSPALAADGAGRVIEVHKSEGAASTLWRRMGTLDPSRGAVVWGPSEPFDTGALPALAASGARALQAHGSEAGNTLWYSTSLVHDRARWMGALPSIERKPLPRITLPGTHDSGAYDLTTDLAACRDVDLPGALQRPFAVTQAGDLGYQLRGGIRYFDLRPAYHEATGALHAYHALIGPRMELIVDQVATFLRGVDRELVVLSVSSFCAFDDARHERLVTMFKDALGPYLVYGDDVGLRTRPFAELVAGGPRVVLLYDSDYLERHPEAGFYPRRALDVFDQYSNTDSFATMREDQYRKMLDNAADGRSPFLLSWTLTFRGNVLDGTLRNLTKKANRHLPAFVADHGNERPVHVLYVDFFEDARVVDLAVGLNRGP